MGKKYYHISPPNSNDLDGKIREVFTTFGREDDIALYTKCTGEILLDLTTRKGRGEFHTIKEAGGTYEDVIRCRLFGKDMEIVLKFSSDFDLLDFLINRY